MKYFWMALLCCITGSQAMAQDTYSSSGGSGYHYHKKEGFDPSRLVYSGGLGLSFGDYTDIGIFPMIGYRITDHFVAGIGLGYEYLRIKNPDNDVYTYANGVSTYVSNPLKVNIFTPSVWTRYKLLDNIFVEGRFEEEFQHYKYLVSAIDPNDPNVSIAVPATETHNTPVLLLGGGYCQPVGGNVSLTVSLLYDVIQNQYSPYYKTVYFGTGFIVGF